MELYEIAGAAIMPTVGKPHLPDWRGSLEVPSIKTRQSASKHDGQLTEEETFWLSFISSIIILQCVPSF